MGIIHKKWFAMGLIGIFVIIGGGMVVAVMIITISIIKRNTLPSIQSLLIPPRHYAMFAVFIYIGICICVIGGVLAIVGWVRYYQLKHRDI